MRRFLLATTILVAPLTAAAQTCSLDSLAAPAAQTAPAPAVATAAPMPRIGDDEIRGHQVLRRLASRGATLRDLGVEHGLRGVLAQAPGGADAPAQVFYLLPDGQAAIAGQMWDVSNADRQAWDVTGRQVAAFLPTARGQGRAPILMASVTVPPIVGAADTVRPIASAEIAANVVLSRLAAGEAGKADIGEDHGVRGIFAWTATEFQNFYLTPDGKAVVAGVLWDLAEPDPARRNVTLRQTRSIPGVVPTVAIGPQAAAVMPQQTGVQVAANRPQQASQGSQQVDGLALLAGAHVGLVGQDGAPRLTMLIDPMCPFSVRAMDELRPAIAAGQLQVALVPVAGLDSHNGGQSTPAARALLSADPTHIAEAWTTIVDAARRREPNGLPVNADAAAKVAANNAIAAELRVESLPVLIWRKPGGAAATFVGSGGVSQVLNSIER